MDTGCYIDGSHMSSFDYMVEVVRFAADRGYKIERAVMDEDVSWMRSDHEKDEEREWDILFSLEWTYEGAIEYLNDIDNPAGRWWFTEDQSLFMEESDA